ncbi:5,6-dimethylbenzimidazole synthase [Devosia sp. 1566]|uniref:5,6-dimethylbenzimidazole synthase n=1 Tax=Devosia sp. 1566 TaxID=2499144 RepID=UPI000FD7FC88|nr:5,6-dimethylbenzimidazole synthase [Devosia sp. 1566]
MPASFDRPAALQYAPSGPFSAEEKAAVYRAIQTRRDVRRDFLPDAIPEPVLWRMLEAAHHAPSVGLMQPWNFLIVTALAQKARIRAIFERANAEAMAMFPPERRGAYAALKLEGILQAPVGICVTCDPGRAGPVALGATHMPDMAVFSTVCAIQNLWLAGRAEGVGVGWVSILDEGALKEVLGIPSQLRVVAYLCAGLVEQTMTSPELEQRGWRQRLPLEQLVYRDRWGETA